MCLHARLQRLDRGNAALEIVARTVAAVEEMRDCVVKAEKSGGLRVVCGPAAAFVRCHGASPCGQSRRSEEHTSELQSLMRISYAVFCLKKKTKHTNNKT